MKPCKTCYKLRPSHAAGNCNTCYKREVAQSKKNLKDYTCGKCSSVRSRKIQNARGLCRPCNNKESSKQYAKANRQSLRLYTKKWKAQNQDKVQGYWKKIYEKNRKSILAKNAAYAKANPHLAKAKGQKRRAAKKRANPLADFKRIAAVYKNCPSGMQVDHIIPLQNENVCGLHCSWNLQYLSKEANARKNNQFDGTYDNQGWSKK